MWIGGLNSGMHSGRQASGSVGLARMVVFAGMAFATVGEVTAVVVVALVPAVACASVVEAADRAA